MSDKAGAPRLNLADLSAVSEMLLAPLYWRAVESRRADALLRDPKAAELVSQIDYDFSRFDKWSNEDKVLALLRMLTFDRHARAFLAAHPGGLLVEIGCGLDTRFYRVDNGNAEWCGLDLPEVIALRRKLMPDERRSHCLAVSMLDFAWLDALPYEAIRPCLFLAEGVFPYFEEAEVRRLVLALKSRFPGAELVFDATDAFFVWVHNLELSRKKMRARLHFGLKNGRQMENWAPGIRLLDEWFYFDQPVSRLGGMNLLRHFPPLGKASAIRHYKLGEKQEL
jgi:O-methyltransferase involved in polyketide biosynthesis